MPEAAQTQMFKEEQNPEGANPQEEQAQTQSAEQKSSSKKGQAKSSSNTQAQTSSSDVEKAKRITAEGRVKIFVECVNAMSADKALAILNLISIKRCNVDVDGIPDAPKRVLNDYLNAGYNRKNGCDVAKVQAYRRNRRKELMKDFGDAFNKTETTNISEALEVLCYDSRLIEEFINSSEMK